MANFKKHYRELQNAGFTTLLAQLLHSSTKLIMSNPES